MVNLYVEGVFRSAGRFDCYDALDEGFVRRGIDGDGLPHQSIKQLASSGRPPPMESESEQLFVSSRTKARTVLVERLDRLARDLMVQEDLSQIAEK